MENLCNHKFHSVYYGSEWEIECENCDKNIREFYSDEEISNYIDNLHVKTRVVKVGNKFSPQYLYKYISWLFQNKEKWKTFQRWHDGCYDLIGTPLPEGYCDVEFNSLNDAEKFILEKRLWDKL